jgi:Do/DeqQ family serine protease
MRRWVLWSAIALIALAVGIVWALSLQGPSLTSGRPEGSQEEGALAQPAAEPVFTTVQATAPVDKAEDLLLSLTKEELQALITAAGQNAIKAAIRRVAPAVVQIEVVRQGPSPFERFFDDPFFKRFFEPFVPEIPEGHPRRSLGSGFFIAYEGEKYVLTNNHVVEGAVSITLTPPDHKPLQAEIVGTDAQLDLAVLRVIGSGAEDVPVVELGDSDRVEIGDWVIAIGNPFNLGHTVTAGIISQLHRDILRPDGKGYFRDMIQTDAAINPGNSGGPLVDAKGRVIGINTAIVANAAGLGFAIPINSAKRVLDQLITQGEVIRAWIGVLIDDPHPCYLGGLEVQQSGVLIRDTIAGMPAEGLLKPKDIILSVDGEPTSSIEDLKNAIQYHKVGEVVRLEVLRSGERIMVEIELMRKPSEEELEKLLSPRPALGLMVQTNSAGLAEQLGLNTCDGVIITEVQPGSLAAAQGLKPDDVILEVSNREIHSVEDWNLAVAQLGREVVLRVMSGSVERLVILSP